MDSFYQKFSSPLKIILTGEHSVVYSKNAIAAAINLRYFCEIQEQYTKEMPSFLIFFNEKIIESFSISNLFQILDEIKTNSKLNNLLEYNIFKEKTIENPNLCSFCNDKDFFYVFFYMFTEAFYLKSKEPLLEDFFKEKTISVKINTKVPDLTGVGSSASYLSVITACLLVIFFFFFLLIFIFIKKKYFQNINKILFKVEKNEDFKYFVDLVNQKTFNFEKIYHSTPSGVDNTVITNGGLILYNKINGMQFLKSNFLDLYFELWVVNTKISKDTKKAVENVRKIFESSDEAKKNIDLIGNVTDGILEILTKTGDEIEIEKKIEEFSGLIDTNQKLLRYFGLCNEKIDKLIE